MKRLRFLFLLLLCVILITGCVRKRVIDDVNIAVGMGIDKSNGQLNGSILIPVFKADRAVENFTFTAKGEVTRDLISKMQTKASQPIVGGSLDVVLIGEKMAREGILQVLDVFLREPTIGAGLYLAVVDGSPEEIFKGDYGDRGNAQYLRQLMEHNMEGGNLPLSNLHRFLFDYYQKGKDAYLPLLKKTDPKLVNIIGIALFKGDKVVDTLHEEEMFYFKLLVDPKGEGAIKVKKKHGASFVKSLKSQHKMKLIRREPYEFAIDIKIKGSLIEHQGRILKKDELIGIEKQMEKQIVKKCTAMIQDFQKKEIDPVGFGHFAKTKTRNFDFKKWQESYKTAQIKVNADVEIIELGVVE